MKPRARASDLAFGVAIASDRIVIAPQDASVGPRYESFPISSPGGVDGFAPIAEALTSALWTTRTRLGASRATIAVALLPPLAHGRVIDMRGLSDDEIERVLSRDVASYFPVGTTPQVVGTCTVRHAASRTSAVLAATAPRALIDAIHDSAAAAGCSVTTIVPAAAAWAAATERVWPAKASAARSLVAALDGQIDVLTVERGQLTALRRVRSAPPDHRPVIDTLAADAEVMLLGEPRLTEQLAQSLKAHGKRLTAPTRDAELVVAPGALAAAFAPAVTGAPQLLLERIRTDRRQRETLRGVWMFAVSVALLVGAGATELWGTRRELAAVTAERLSLRGRLAGVWATRDTISMLAERLSALRAAEVGVPRWSDALALVAAYLPRDAHLLSLRAEADSLLLEGVAHRAAPVFDAMARAPAALAVRAHGSIRQEVRDDVGQVERFTMSVRLTRDIP